MPEITNIAPAIFRRASLIVVSFGGPWSGQVTVKEDHLPLIKQESSRFIKKGQLLLLPKENLKKFEALKKATSKHIINFSKPFVDELPQVRLVSNHDIEEIDTFLRGQREEWTEMARTYSNTEYLADKAMRQAELRLTFPLFAEHMEAYYPNAAKIYSDCNMKWLFFQVQDLEAYDAVMTEKKAEFANSMNSFVQNMAQEFRTSAVQAALAFKKGMDRAKATVDGRVVDKFKEWLERIEQNDLLDDVELRHVLDNIKGRVFAVEAWDVKKDAAAFAEIQTYLDEVQRLGEVEGAAANVASAFVRTVSAESVSIEATNEQLVGAGAGDRFERVVEVIPPASDDAQTIDTGMMDRDFSAPRSASMDMDLNEPVSGTHAEAEAIGEHERLVEAGAIPEVGEDEPESESGGEG